MLSDSTNPIDGDLTTGGINAELRGYLRTAGKWGRFVSITAMVLIGLFVVMLIFGGGAMLAALTTGLPDGGSSAGAGIGGTVILVIYFIAFAIGFFLYYLLLQFSNNAIRAANTGSEAQVTAAMKPLATFFKIFGILTAIYVAIIGLALIGGIAGGLFAAFG